jgi:hypothetical protein
MGFKNKTVLAAAIISLSAYPLMAAEQLVQVESYGGVSVGTGMVAEVTCGGENSVILKGEKKVLDNIIVEIKNNTLHIMRKENTGSMINKLFSSGNKSSGHVEVAISTTSDLSVIETSTGASINVPECAVNVSSLTVEASTGSTVNVSGITSQLSLDMSTGSTFNRKAGPFTVDNALVDLSTGATANLCGATTVVGDASTGASIQVGSNTQTDVDLSIGAETSSRRCK